MTQQPKAYCYYLGEKRPIYLKVDKATKKANVQYINDDIVCTSPVEGEVDISKALKSFYKKECRKLITKRLKFYQPNFKVKYKSVTIESHDKRWGSCSSNRDLTFHWRLILYPENIIDYVVVHELCHMRHMNHDRSFWRLVGKIYPNYKEAIEILGSKK